MSQLQSEFPQGAPRGLMSSSAEQNQFKGLLTPALVFFILGGPGSGKGTNCSRLSRDFGFVHICAGDLLRAEAKLETELGQTIRTILANGQIVPSEITMRLLTNALSLSPDAKGFLIDGFPRKLDQAEMFERDICTARRVVYFECSEAVMEKRLLGRNTGRADDDPEVIRKRFRANVEQCVPVVEKYKKEGRVDVVDCNVGTIDEIYEKVKMIFVGYGCVVISPDIVTKRSRDTDEDFDSKRFKAISVLEAASCCLM